MSTEYFPTSKISWDVFLHAPLPKPLREHTPDKPLFVRGQARYITDGAFYLVAHKGRPTLEDGDITYFEAFGKNQRAEGAGRMLDIIGEMFDCVFVSEIGASVSAESYEEEWDDEDQAAASAARGRKIP